MKKTFLLVLIFIFSITKTFACTCIEANESLSKKVKKAFTQSDLIITGKVIDIEIVIRGKMKSSADPIIYSFEITKKLNGNIKKQVIEIVSASDGASCGYSFELGESYLVYSRRSNRFSSITNNEFDFVTGLCDRNQKLKTIKKRELRKLRKLNCKKRKQLLASKFTKK